MTRNLKLTSSYFAALLLLAFCKKEVSEEVNLGHKFPNFSANTTEGYINFYNWLGNSYVHMYFLIKFHSITLYINLNFNFANFYFTCTLDINLNRKIARGNSNNMDAKNFMTCTLSLYF